MVFFWKKLGRIFNPETNKRHTRLLTHAANPLPINLEGNIYRVFYSGRDSHNRSSIGAVDIDILERKIVQEHFEPFFICGPKGSFYSDGVSIGNCYEVNGMRYMLFMGWQNEPNEHWRGDIGRLIVRPDLSLVLDNELPFLGIDDVDPVSLSYPWIMQKVEGDGYHMWYGSTIEWDAGNNEMLHVINYASSKDGSNWDRKGQVLPYILGEAQAFSRPTVIFNPEIGYEMWYSYRGGNITKYRIGYAFSKDGLSWELMNEKSGIDISIDGWDSEMIEYPFVFEHNEQLYMLYNGNGYGKTGFGLAVLEKD